MMILQNKHWLTALIVGTSFCSAIAQTTVIPTRQKEDNKAAFEMVLDNLVRGYKKSANQEKNQFYYTSHCLRDLEINVKQAKLLFIQINKIPTIEKEFAEFLDFFIEHRLEKKIYAHHIQDAQDSLTHFRKKTKEMASDYRLMRFCNCLEQILQEDYAAEYSDGQAVYNAVVRQPTRLMRKHPLAVVAVLGSAVLAIYWLKNRGNAVTHDSGSGASSEPSSSSGASSEPSSSVPYTLVQKESSDFRPLDKEVVKKRGDESYESENLSCVKLTKTIETRAIFEAGINNEFNQTQFPEVFVFRKKQEICKISRTSDSVLPKLESGDILQFFKKIDSLKDRKLE